MPELNLGLKLETRRKSRALRVVLGGFVLVGIVAAMLVLIPVVKFFLWAKSSDLHAFKIPSGSMCPAICENERIIAGMDAFDHRAPERGEVILFDHEMSGAKFVKRVVAVGGDMVTPGPNGAVLVNGIEVKFPPPCGEQITGGNRATYEPPFESQRIPQNSFFVLGDNLNNSLDSRISSFGLVRRDQVRGKALLIYWSSHGTRIGCKIQ
jgi:signal peptidase I